MKRHPCTFFKRILHTLIRLQYRYILHLVYMSFRTCDIIIQFAVHLYDCTLYESSLQFFFNILTWFFFHSSKMCASESPNVTSFEEVSG